MPSIFDLPFLLPDEELFESLVETGSLQIERIISTGQTTPEGQWYEQPRAEWAILLQGEAEILYEDGERVDLKAGDYVFISPRRKHRVTYTRENPPCIWLAVHYDGE
jgi:cupin 2 domain-containing protein